MGARVLRGRPDSRGGHAPSELPESPGRARTFRQARELPHVVLRGGAAHGGGAAAAQRPLAPLAALVAGRGGGWPARSRGGVGSVRDDAPARCSARTTAAPPARSAVPGVLPGYVHRRGRGGRGHLGGHSADALRARQGGAQAAPRGRTRMSERDDEELRERFAALRREHTIAAPVFRDTMAAARSRPRPPRPRRGRRLGFAAGAALLLVALVLILTVRNRHRTTVDLASVRVHAPTDFLLQLPGADLLRTMPRLGRVSFDRRTL